MSLEDNNLHSLTDAHTCVLLASITPLNRVVNSSKFYLHRSAATPSPPWCPFHFFIDEQLLLQSSSCTALPVPLLFVVLFAPFFLHCSSCRAPPAHILMHHSSKTAHAKLLLHCSSCIAHFTPIPSLLLLHHSSCTTPKHHSSCTTLKYHSSCTACPAPFNKHGSSCTYHHAPLLLHISTCTDPALCCCEYQQNKKTILMHPTTYQT